jgi:hypothetical protein
MAESDLTPSELADADTEIRPHIPVFHRAGRSHCPEHDRLVVMVAEIHAQLGPIQASLKRLDEFMTHVRNVEVELSRRNGNRRVELEREIGKSARELERQSGDIRVLGARMVALATGLAILASVLTNLIFKLMVKP